MVLYISDLDGTLLNPDQELSEKTISTINGLIDKGMMFSIATARSFYSCKDIISRLNLSLPIILHNGVFVYDLKYNVNISANLLGRDIVEEIIQICEEYDVYPLMYTIHPTLANRVYYRGIFNRGEEHYIKGRLDAGDKRLVNISDYTECLKEQIITLVIMGEYASLDKLYSTLKSRYDLTLNFTEDIYSKAYWLEITHVNANKGWAVEFLKKYVNAKRLVCFGDNLNDLGMFTVADEKYAVNNAYTELKDIATEIIGSNEDDSVAKFLSNCFA